VSFGDSAKEDRDYARVRMKIDGGYDKHGDVFVIARPLTGSVSFPVKKFDGAKAVEQFIEEFTFFRYVGRCPSWESVLFANDCFSDEEKCPDTLKGESYTSEEGRAYVIQLIASGKLVVHETGSWIPSGDRNHHLPWPTKPSAEEEVLPVVDHRFYKLGPHDGPGYEDPEKTRTMQGGEVVPNETLVRQHGLDKIPLQRTEGLGTSSTTKELLSSGAIPGKQGVILDQRTVSFDDIWKMSDNTGVEFILTKENRNFVLRSGAATSAPIKSGVRPIVHTHPKDDFGVNSLFPSNADINVLNALWARNPNGPRPVSQILTGEQTPTRFFATGLESLPKPKVKN